MRRRLVPWVALVVVALVAGPVEARRQWPQAFEAPVIAVSDGDTFVVRYGGRNLRVRVAGVDAPELKQPYGRQARAFTAGLVLDKVVRIEPRTVDSYDRIVARVLTPDGKDLAEELLRNGLAWWYRHYARDQRLASLEAEAKSQRRGLWADPDPVPPWLYRRAPVFQ
ncbi:MAG: thermonuclease family protein [Candidatus Binatia bacterium]|nr:thermonuclease family protein [Candidatus Binatia bacterium]